VLVPVSPIYTSFEVEYMVKDSGAETVICLDTNFSYVKEVADKTGLKTLSSPTWRTYCRHGNALWAFCSIKFQTEKWTRTSGSFFQVPTETQPLSTPVSWTPGKIFHTSFTQGGPPAFPKAFPETISA
jgi:long-chain acyl-CoA synthetase